MTDESCDSGRPALPFRGQKVFGATAVQRIKGAIRRMKSYPESERRDEAISTLREKLEAAKQGEVFIVRDVLGDYIRAVAGEIGKLTKGTLLERRPHESSRID